MPVWLETLDLSDLWHDENRAFEEKRDAIVQRIRDSAWFKAYDEGSTLHWYVREIEAAGEAGDFDLYMHGVYNIADVDRVWIK